MQSHKKHGEHSRDFLSERVRRVSPSGIRRFFDLIGTIEGVISLGVGEPDFTTPWHIREAAIYSLEHGYTMYTSNYGLLELREELSRYLLKLYGVKYDPASELLITVGVSEALDLALRAVIDNGDEVLMPDPCYVAYPACTVLAGGIPVMVPTHIENDFKISARDVEAFVTPKSKALLIGYPSNPTGAVMDYDDLSKLALLANEHDLIVVSDEIYGRLIYNSNHTCFASLPDMREQTILLGGFSKAYAMTGWRVGYAAARAEVIEAMTKIHQYSILCTPIVSQKAALEALREGEADVAEMVSEYNRRRLVMQKGLNDIGLVCFEPKGAFYTFPSISITGMSSEQFTEKLLLEEKVAVVPGSAFGSCGEGYVRCCYAVSMDEIEEALIRIKRFVERHRINRL